MTLLADRLASAMAAEALLVMLARLDEIAALALLAALEMALAMALEAEDEARLAASPAWRALSSARRAFSCACCASAWKRAVDC